MKAPPGGALHGDHGGEMVVQWFSLCFEHLLPLFVAEETGFFRQVLDRLGERRLHPAGSPLAVLCHRLIAEVPPRFDLEHRSQLLRVAAAIVGVELQAEKGRHAGLTRPEEHLLQKFESLSADEIVNLSVEELARKFACSRRHLNRLFHHHFGLAAASLKMEMRLLKAVSLLRDPDAKVINVAQESGFNHLGLFNICFKRRFGVSPGKWRKAPRVKRPSSRLVDLPRDCRLAASGLCPWAGKAGTIKRAAPRLPLRRKEEDERSAL